MKANTNTYNKKVKTLKVKTTLKAGALVSDRRYKKNIEMFTDALNKVMQLRGVRFEYRTDEFPDQDLPDGEQVGFIAQEVIEVLPEVVEHDQDGFMSVGYSNIVAVLVEAIQQQQQVIEEQLERLDRLEATIQRLAPSHAYGQLNSDRAAAQITNV